MPKYDVFPNPSGDGYLLDVQTGLLSKMNTRVVVPLLPLSSAPTPGARLNPVFNLDGEAVVMVTQLMAAVPVSMLRTPSGRLDGEFEAITSAIDMLIYGFEN
jgi:toxin CcdB